MCNVSLRNTCVQWTATVILDKRPNGTWTLRQSGVKHAFNAISADRCDGRQSCEDHLVLKYWKNSTAHCWTSEQWDRDTEDVDVDGVHFSIHVLPLPSPDILSCDKCDIASMLHW